MHYPVGFFDTRVFVHTIFFYWGPVAFSISTPDAGRLICYRLSDSVGFHDCARLTYILYTEVLEPWICYAYCLTSRRKPESELGLVGDLNLTGA